MFSEGEQGELVGCSEPVERGDLRQAGRDEQEHRPGGDSKNNTFVKTAIVLTLFSSGQRGSRQRS